MVYLPFMRHFAALNIYICSHLFLCIFVYIIRVGLQCQKLTNHLGDSKVCTAFGPTFAMKIVSKPQNIFLKDSH